MKDPIINKINSDRNGFDKDQPDAKVWNNIHQELHPEKKKNTFIWLKIAAAFAILFSAIWLYNYQPFKENGEMAQVETTMDSSFLIYEGIPFEEQEAGPGRVVRRGRGGDWQEVDDFLKNKQRNLENQVQFQPFHGNVFKTNVTWNFGDGITDLKKVQISHFYLDQTEITNNEYRAFVYSVKDKLLAEGKTTWSHDLNPDALYSVGASDINNCVGQAGEFILDTEPGYYYEQYDDFDENQFIKTFNESISTFSIDVDAAGYSNMRRFINDGYLPPKNAVKLEEMINYFDYKLPDPKNDRPFAVTTELGKCPWNEKHQLFQICMKGKTIAQEDFAASNLVFLIDVSGSMDEPNKLPLLKQGFKLLVKQLRAKDKVAIVVYAGNAGLVMPSTPGDNKDLINEAIENLNAGGSTAGGEGIQLAYQLAEKNFIKGGNNRIILATDGDFNVGVSDDDALIKLVEEKRKSGVFLSVLGFGEGNLQASKMEKIADNGNGNYSYIDNILEAKKVLVTEMGGTLYTIAKDVKLQLEFNPKAVESYRLLGYENRMLATEDFENDQKDAGDLGSGHTIVALYEIVPADGKEKIKNDLKYQTKMFATDEDLQDELVTVKLRYKKPTESKSKLITYAIKNKVDDNDELSNNFLFASAVAEFGLLIRDSEYKAQASFDKLIERARDSKGDDVNGYRAEFIKLCEMAEILYTDYHSKKKPD